MGTQPHDAPFSLGEGAMHPQTTTFGLVDMPAAWLQKLPKALNPGARLASFQTCRALRDLMLSEFGVALQLQADTLLQQPAQTQASLALTCTLSPSIILRLHGGDAEAGMDVNAAATSLVSGASQAAGLTAIKSVELQGLALDALVPSWLTSCPNMTSLKLHSCQLSGAPLPPIPFGQLEQLQLHTPPDLRSVATIKSIADQVLGLTGLRSLSVCDWRDAPPPTWLAFFADNIGAHLTRLETTPRAYPWSYEKAGFAGCFPAITELHLRDHMVRDEDMEELLLMTGVRSLQCHGFEFMQSHAHHPLPWTRIAMTHELDLSSLARLPLAGVQSLQVSPAEGSFKIFSNPDMEILSAVVAAIGGCGGLKWDSSVREVLVLHSYGRVPGLIPILTNLLTGCPASHITLSHVEGVTPELLAVMTNHLTAPKLTTIRLPYCTFCPTVWPVLLPGLPPHVDTLCLEGMDRSVTEATVTKALVHASRPMCVEMGARVCEGWKAGWELRAQAAMARAGHQHIKIVCTA